MTAKVLDHIGSVSNLEGFSGLRKEDQARVRRAFELGYVEECREVEDKVRSCVCVCCVCGQIDVGAYREPIPRRVCVDGWVSTRARVCACVAVVTLVV